MTKEMYVTYDRSLYCGAGKPYAAIYYAEIDKYVAGIEFYFQYQHPFAVADHTDDPYTAEPISAPIGAPSSAPRMSFDPKRGFSFPNSESPAQTLSADWVLAEVFFDVATHPLGAVFDGTLTTLEIVQDFLDTHGSKIQADDWLEGTCLAWSDEPVAQGLELPTIRAGFEEDTAIENIGG